MYFSCTDSFIFLIFLLFHRICNILCTASVDVRTVPVLVLLNDRSLASHSLTQFRFTVCKKA